MASSHSHEDIRVNIFEAVCRMAAEGAPELLGVLVDPETGERTEDFQRVVDAFEKSLIGSGFPGFWMEAPLIGKAEFDLHVYFDRPKLAPGDTFLRGDGYGMQKIFDWYINRETGGVGLGFAHDLRGTGDDAPGSLPATYINVNNAPLDDMFGFFESAGMPEAAMRFRSLALSLPKEWRVWYMGIFAGREGVPVRAGSFVASEAQQAYAQDVSLFEKDLRATGFTAIDDDMLDKLHKLAQLPLQLEIQLDKLEDGSVSDVLSVSLATRTPGPKKTRESFRGGEGQQAMELLESWGIADARWREIPDASLGKLLPMGAFDVSDLQAGSEKLPSGVLMSSTPSFIKVKWADGKLGPAKVYMNCSGAIVG